jgi:hypothetical protein
VDTDEELHAARLFLRLMRLRGPPEEADRTIEGILRAVVRYLRGRDDFPKDELP